MLDEDWARYLPNSVLSSAIDVHVKSHPTRMTRSWMMQDSGLYRLARRDCILELIQVVSIGAWGSIVCFDGNGRKFWNMPSIFTGNFAIKAGLDNGLIVHAVAGPGPDAGISFKWVERDAQMV